EMKLDRMQAELSTTWPGFKRTPDADGNDRHSQFERQYCRALLELCDVPINGPGSFGKYQERLPLFQARRPRLHRAHEIHVWVDPDHPSHFRKTALERILPIFAVTENKDVLDDGLRKDGYNQRSV